jgi:hypothetical protein
VKSITVAMLRKVIVLATGWLMVNPRRSAAGVSCAQERQANRDIDISSGAEIIPRRLVAKIEKRGNGKGKGRQTRGESKFTEHHVVRGEVQGRDDDPEGDRFGQRPTDADSARTGNTRVRVRLRRQRNRRSRLGTGRGSRTKRRPSAPPQLGEGLGREDGGCAKQNAWNQGRFDQRGAAEYGQSHGHISIHAITGVRGRSRNAKQGGPFSAATAPTPGINVPTSAVTRASLPMPALAAYSRFRRGRPSDRKRHPEIISQME